MPEISRFFGIIVTMYHNDHPPPHFHAKYAEYKAKIEIATGDVIAGSLPTRALSMVEEWRQQHMGELTACWSQVISHEIPARIEPLE